jgi:aspartyl-tRNA(Asn)/glutamyl-tRNA(Gln) amidotransferase subunit C
MAQISATFGQSESKQRDGIGAAWREDVPQPSLPHSEAMKNAPESDGDFFKVPRVIEK